MNRPDTEINAYLDGGITAEQTRTLEAWINAAPDNASAFLYTVQMHQQIGQRLGKLRLREQHKQDKADRPHASDSDVFDAEVLEALLQVEAKSGDPQLRDLTDHLQTNKAPQVVGRKKPDERLKLGDIAVVAGYLSLRAVKTKTAAYAAIAALLLLGVSLFGPFSGSDQTQTAQTPPEPNVASPAAESVRVATLTAQQDAQWSGPGLALGDAFHAGQRLTLTQGFAEITTEHGAVAILQAPCTIQMIDSPNAMRLVSGKLVGICETKSSKGFLVRTAALDVTDLGTRFGVDASQPDVTEVHVFMGVVQASQTARGTSQPIVLTAGEALKADAVQAERIAFDANLFKPDAFADALRPRFEGLEAIWLGRVSGDVRSNQQTSKALQVYLEQAGFILSEPVAVDIDQDTPWPGKALASRTVAAGQRVDIYLLHLDTPGDYSIDLRDGSYTIHFDRPILGVIGHESTLRATDGRLGVAGVLYPPMPTDPGELKWAASGIDNVATFGKPDIVTVTKDGQSLKLRLNSSTQLDQLRVLVQATDR